MTPFRLLFALLSITTMLVAPGCARAMRTIPSDPVTAGVVPGCPATSEGAPSECTWRRALWAAEVWERGGIDMLITSGGAVHNPFIEAKVTRAALISLGVPASRVFTETQALHTDENIAYSLDVADTLGVHRLVGISDPGQARGICQMALMWGWECDPAPLETKLVKARLNEKLPKVKVEPVPEGTWEHWTVQERRLREARGQKPRPSSSAIYFSHFIVGVTGGTLEKPQPPMPEPSLARAEVQAHR